MTTEQRKCVYILINMKEKRWHRTWNKRDCEGRRPEGMSRKYYKTKEMCLYSD